MSATGSSIGYELMTSDATAAAAKAAIEQGGGKVMNGPHQVPDGDRVVIAVDQQGAAFGVVGPQGAHA